MSFLLSEERLDQPLAESEEGWDDDADLNTHGKGYNFNVQNVLALTISRRLSSILCLFPSSQGTASTRCFESV